MAYNGLSSRQDVLTQISDVARAAGVSSSTVSRVLNRPNLVKEETKEKVYDAMQKVGYTPPLRKEATRTYTIGLAVPDITIHFVGELIRNLEQELENTGYGLLLFNMKRERKVSRYFRESAAFKKKVDALIIFSASLDDECVEFFRAVNIPIVLLQSRCGREKSISTNNYLGASNAVQFLAASGYREIGFIGWNPEDDHINERFLGYKNTIEKAGVPFRPELTASGALSIEGGYTATRELFQRGRPEAVFYACDSLAFGGYRYFNERNIRIPEDVGVIGFDDLEFASVLALTTMKQFIQRKARMAVSYLFDRLSGKIGEPLAEEICVTPTLVVRGSTRNLQR
jgi:LacI family transcriptional regulator